MKKNIDIKHLTFAKQHLYNVLLEFQELGCTPGELVEALKGTDLHLVNNTMFILQDKSNLYTILRAVAVLLTADEILLNKCGYETVREKKLLEYIEQVLEKANTDV